MAGAYPAGIARRFHGVAVGRLSEDGGLLRTRPAGASRWQGDPGDGHWFRRQGMSIPGAAEDVAERFHRALGAYTEPRSEDVASTWVGPAKRTAELSAAALRWPVGVIREVVAPPRLSPGAGARGCP